MVDTSKSEPELLLVGYVRKAHGVRGEVSVRLTTNRTERVEPGTTLVVGETARTIISSRPNKDDFLVQFEGVRDRNSCLLYTSPSPRDS